MPRVQHSKEKNTTLIVGSEKIELDGDGVAEVSEELYAVFCKDRIPQWQPIIERNPLDVDGDGDSDLSTDGKADAAIEAIQKMTDATVIKAFTAGENRVTVLEAAEVRYQEL